MRRFSTLPSSHTNLDRLAWYASGTLIRSAHEDEFRKTKGFFQTGFEFGAGFTLGSTLLLIPVGIIVWIAAAICGLA